LRRRQSGYIETAKLRLEKVTQAQQKKTQRAKTIEETVVHVPAHDFIERDTKRLLSGTKASEGSKLTVEALDDAERRRRSSGAHGAAVPMSGRDLQFGGRSTPQWMKGSSHF
jgi:hypothetical protein